MVCFDQIFGSSRKYTKQKSRNLLMASYWLVAESKTYYYKGCFEWWIHRGDARMIIEQVQNIFMCSNYATPPPKMLEMHLLSTKFSRFFPFVRRKTLSWTIIHQEGCITPVAKFLRVQMHPLHPLCRRPWYIQGRWSSAHVWTISKVNLDFEHPVLDCFRCHWSIYTLLQGKSLLIWKCRF